MTLVEALDRFRAISIQDDEIYGDGINVVLHIETLADIQKKTRISLKADNVGYTDFIYAICKRLGLGFRLDSNALVIAGGNHIKLMKPPTRTAMGVAAKIVLEFPPGTPVMSKGQN